MGEMDHDETKAAETANRHGGDYAAPADSWDRTRDEDARDSRSHASPWHPLDGPFPTD